MAIIIKINPARIEEVVFEQVTPEPIYDAILVHTYLAVRKHFAAINKDLERNAIDLLKLFESKRPNTILGGDDEETTED